MCHASLDGAPCRSCQYGAIPRQQCPDNEPGNHIDCSNVDFKWKLDVCSNGDALPSSYTYQSGDSDTGDANFLLLLFLMAVFTIQMLIQSNFCRSKDNALLASPASFSSLDRSSLHNYGSFDSRKKSRGLNAIPPRIQYMTTTKLDNR